jgi:hypothetical protein
VLRPVAASDVAALHELWMHPDVRRFLWDDAVLPRDETAPVVARSEASFAESGHGLWPYKLGAPTRATPRAALHADPNPADLSLLFAKGQLEPLFASLWSVSITASSEKLPPFCRGGNSLNVARNCPTNCCAGTSRKMCSIRQRS